ncbi:MAG: serine/threonine protein kinase [Candidatus Paceibacteria bacterium]
MADEELRDRFWNATFEQDDVNYDAFLEEGGEGMRGAIDAHKLLLRATQNWKQAEQPQFLGRFQVVGDLGEGGLGRVYLGWDPELRRNVAIKVIAQDRWAVNEARAIAQLDHRSIVKVYEVGHDRIVMEPLQGGSLRDHIQTLDEGGKTPFTSLRSRIHCLVQLAEGLAYCHERGILHRDIKPGNVLFAEGDDHPRLVDFGLAHLDELDSLDITQNLVGTPAYLAPEQVESGETGTDSRSDIFSFGVLAYELLTLECPFKRDTRTATLSAIAEARTLSPRALSESAPPALQHLIQHCLEVDPRDRYQTMVEVAADLQNALANRPISIGGQTIAHRGKLLYRRNQRVTRFAITAVSLTTVTGLLLLGRSIGAERRAFASEIQEISNQLAELDNSREFTNTGLILGESLVRSRALDSELLASTLFGSPLADVQALTERWSRRLGEVVARIEEDSSSQRRTDTWKAAFQIEEHLLPEAEWNRKFRNRGRVVLTGDLANLPELTIFKQEYRGEGMLTGWIEFNQTSFEPHASVGCYRAVLPGVWERDYLVQSNWQEEIQLSLVPQMHSTHDWLDLPESGIRVSPRITFRQFRKFCAHTGRVESGTLASLDEAEYSGPWSEMNAYAVWSGGRLPSAAEVVELLDRFGNPSAGRFQGEFVSDCFHLDALDLAWYVKYEDIELQSDAPPKVWAEEVPRYNQFEMEEGRLLGFRIVYPLGAK